MARIVGEPHEGASVNAAFGWALAAGAVAVGWVAWGWQGALLAVTVVVFWLLLQFSRALRTMRMAAGAPVGSVDSAVMLNAKLHAGMTLSKVIPLTRSLGRRTGDEPEAWTWEDAAGDRVELRFAAGKLTDWTLDRTPAAPGTADPGP